MPSKTITLRQEHSEKDTWSLCATVEENGDLIIEGQDLGPSVERFWGAGLTEYEWDIKVRAAHIPELIAALGGKEGDDVLSLLAARYNEDDRYASRNFLEQRRVPFEFSNRVGD